MIYWPSKTVAAIQDRSLNWGPTLSKLGDPTIVTSAWSRLRGTATANAAGIIEAGRKTATRITGGTADSITVFRNTVTLSDGQVLDEDCYIKTRA